MAVVRTQINITKCDECPFFERTMANVVAEWMAKAAITTRSGTCRYKGIGVAWPFNRAHVPDANLIPEKCPLRSSDCLITLGIRS